MKMSVCVNQNVLKGETKSKLFMYSIVILFSMSNFIFATHLAYILVELN